MILPEDKQQIPSVVVFVIMCLVIGKCVVDMRDSCPMCKSMGSMDEQPRVLSHQNFSTKKDTEYAVHRDKNWRVTGLTEIPVEKTVAKNVYTVSRQCSKCGYSTSKTVTD